LNNKLRLTFVEAFLQSSVMPPPVCNCANLRRAKMPGYTAGKDACRRILENQPKVACQLTVHGAILVEEIWKPGWLAPTELSVETR
jgi:hypothetical protein